MESGRSAICFVKVFFFSFLVVILLNRRPSIWLIVFACRTESMHLLSLIKPLSPDQVSFWFPSVLTSLSELGDAENRWRSDLCHSEQGD